MPHKKCFKTVNRELAEIAISYNHPLVNVEFRLSKKPIFEFSKNPELKQLVYYFRNHVLLTDPKKIADANTLIANRFHEMLAGYAS